MNQNTWDLTKMYKNKKDYEEDLENLKVRIKKFINIDKNILKTSKYFLDTLKEYLDIERKAYFIYNYAKLQSDADGKNCEYVKMVDTAENILEKFGSDTVFIDMNFKKLNKRLLNKFYNETPELKEYNHMFEIILKNKKHLLSLKEEKILSLTSNIRNTYETVFDKLDAVDSKFKDVFGEKLNHSTYSLLLKNSDEKVRKEAFNNYHEYYKNHENTISTCLITSIKNMEFSASIRKYKSARDMEMFHDNINESVYDSLINVVHSNINSFYRYLGLKKKSNNLKEMHMYDLYMSSSFNKKYTIEEAKGLVLNSIKVLGTEYSNIYENSFKERWVDFDYREGKYSGAYSSGSYDSYPYILMNFSGDFRSVETLAHEMGHSMHSYLSKKNNPYHKSHYPIFLAEIASNVNELLLFNYILNNTKDKNEKKFMLENILDSFKNSVFRQTQFAEYEHILHTKIKNNVSLSSEDITNIYYDLNKFYYAKNVINDEMIKYESLRIPHFYYNYYVYKYATGLMIAYVFVNRILENKKGAVENYLMFLKSGGRDYPLNILEESGVKFNDSVMNEAMKLFNKYLDEYEKLIGEANEK